MPPIVSLFIASFFFFVFKLIFGQYLELRYRLLPYLYTAVRDATETGMPVMRALWLHHPDDPRAVAEGSQFLLGRGWKASFGKCMRLCTGG